MTRWVQELLHKDFRIALRADKVLYEDETEHQHLVLFENETFGRVLALDNVIQTTERDEFIYHEMLTHVPILAHGAVRRVLIVGGGDGGMLEETLKHPGVERVTLVEIDAGVVEFSRKYLGTICRDAFDDPRLDLVIADGVEYVAETSERFDLAIVDSTDPIGPGEVLFTERFYAGCKRVLSPGGILVTQNGVVFLQSDELRTTMALLCPLFAETTCYLASVPTYVGGPMAFGWATDETAHRRTALATLQERYAAAGIATRYYTPDVHQGAFALPRYVQAAMAPARDG